MPSFTTMLARMAFPHPTRHSPYRYATFVGVRLGIFNAVTAAIAINLMLALFPLEKLGPSAAAFISNYNTLGVFFLGVIFIPFFETFIAQLLPLELARGVGLNDRACIATGAALFGFTHYLNGGIAHGICATIGGAVFSMAYIKIRPWGYMPSYWASSIAHGTNNFLIFFVAPLILPDIG